jgi:hypothetical protein
MLPPAREIVAACSRKLLKQPCPLLVPKEEDSAKEGTTTGVAGAAGTPIAPALPVVDDTRGSGLMACRGVVEPKPNLSMLVKVSLCRFCITPNVSR